MRTLSRRRAAVSLASLSLVGLAGSAYGTPITFNGSSGNLAASANFDVGGLGGQDLIVTLTNTSAFDVLVPADVLTAVFFDIDPALALVRVSAMLAGGSVVHFDAPPPGGVVGGEWAYKDSLVGAPGTAGLGISSSGLGLFGPGDRFPGGDLDPPPNVDGLNYGITSAGDNPATGNAPVTGGVPLIQNAVVFTLRGLPAGFDPSLQISNVWGQYGTDLATEPTIPLPEPGSMAMLLAGLSFVARRRRA